MDLNVSAPIKLIEPLVVIKNNGLKFGLFNFSEFWLCGYILAPFQTFESVMKYQTVYGTA
jgi:hypothetical protein